MHFFPVIPLWQERLTLSIPDMHFADDWTLHFVNERAEPLTLRYVNVSTNGAGVDIHIATDDETTLTHFAQECPDCGENVTQQHRFTYLVPQGEMGRWEIDCLVSPMDMLARTPLEEE
jgi:hypothetical protein